jgi:hypothetical protein
MNMSMVLPLSTIGSLIDIDGVEILDGIDAISEYEWNRCLPDEIESWRYYRAVEHAGLEGFSLHYLCLHEQGQTRAFAPFFVSRYRLDTSGSGIAMQWLKKISARWPDLLSLPMACMGSPVSEICHVGYAPELTPEQRRDSLRRMVDALNRYAQQERIGLIGIKDAADVDQPLWNAATSAFTRLPGMPCSLLPLPYASLDDYYATLSSKMRKDLRKKARSADALVIEERHNVDDVLPQLMALYEQTRAASDLQFERLPAAYFTRILRQLGERAVCVLYYAEGRLIGFNLLLRNGRQLLDKFIGMDSERARQHNLYFVSWLYNVQWCIRNGVTLYEPGQAGYEAKIRMGCRLLPNWYYFRHRNPLINIALGLLAHVLQMDRFEPALQAGFGDAA